MATDTFICGICNSVFHDITLFVQHKNLGCENTENTIIDKNEDVEDTMTVSVIKVSRNIIMSAPLSNLTHATICCIYILVIEKLMTSKYIIYYILLKIGVHVSFCIYTHLYITAYYIYHNVEK